jgi:ligand-binding sensor domain-containing protein
VANTAYRSIGIVARGDRIYVADSDGLQIRFADGRSERIGTQQGVHGGGPLLLDREGSLWLGTPTGLIQYPETETSTWGERHGMISDHAEYVLASGEGVWLSTWQGLGRLDPVGAQWIGTDVQDEYNAFSATPMCTDGEGTTWLMTRDTDGQSGRVSSIAGNIQRDYSTITRAMDCYTAGDGSVFLAADDSVLRVAPNGTLDAVGEKPVIRSPSKQKIAVSSHGEIHLALDPYVCDARIEALESDGRAAWTCSELPDLGALHDLVSVPGPDGIPELWIASMSGGVVHRVIGGWREVEAMRAIPQRAGAGFFV